MRQEEWLELESDPGLFTLLVEDFGVEGVQVEEIYDLTKPITDQVYGFIFLFRWHQNNEKKTPRKNCRGSVVVGSPSQNNSLSETTDGSRSTPKLTNSVPSSHGLAEYDATDKAGKETENIFFAHQVVPNSCATHSLLCILLNQPHLRLGPMLTEFRKATLPMTPRMKGLAIGHMPHLLQAHNRHARTQTNVDPGLLPCSQSEAEECAKAAVDAALSAKAAGEGEGQGEENGISSDANPEIMSGVPTGTATAADTDTFHFVCFLPVGKCLYELDGLKATPINHGLLKDSGSSSDWTRQCIEILRQRMKDQEVRYNLMALVPDRRIALAGKRELLAKNRSILADTIHQLRQQQQQQQQQQQTQQTSLTLPLDSRPDDDRSSHLPATEDDDGLEETSEAIDTGSERSWQRRQRRKTKLKEEDKELETGLIMEDKKPPDDFKLESKFKTSEDDHEAAIEEEEEDKRVTRAATRAASRKCSDSVDSTDPFISKTSNGLPSSASLSHRPSLPSLRPRPTSTSTGSGEHHEREVKRSSSGGSMVVGSPIEKRLRRRSGPNQLYHAASSPIFIDLCDLSESALFDVKTTSSQLKGANNHSLSELSVEADSRQQYLTPSTASSTPLKCDENSTPTSTTPVNSIGTNNNSNQRQTRQQQQRQREGSGGDGGSGSRAIHSPPPPLSPTTSSGTNFSEVGPSGDGPLRSPATHQSKYPTRSSTRRDTMASHSLANARGSHNPNSSASIVFLESGEEKPTHPPTTNGDGVNVHTEKFLSVDELARILHLIDQQSEICRMELREEEDKRYSYRVDCARRIHNYEPFIRCFLAELEAHNLLRDIISSASAAGNNSNRPTPPQPKKTSRLRISTENSAVRQLRKRPKKEVAIPKKILSQSSSWSSRSSSTSSSTTGGSSATTAATTLNRSLRCVKRARLSSPYRSVNRSHVTASLSAAAAAAAANRRNHNRKVM